MPLVNYSTHSLHSARPRRADGGNPVSGLNETSRCTAGRVSKNARARRCRAQAQKKCLRLVFLQHLWSSPGSQGPRIGAMQPTMTGWSVSGPVGRVGSNSAVFAALSDIKTSGESSDEAPHHRANWESTSYLLTSEAVAICLLSFGGWFSSTSSKIQSLSVDCNSWGQGLAKY